MSGKRAPTSHLEAYLDELRLRPRLRGALAAEWKIAGREASYAAAPDWLAPELRAALVAQGVERLYSHQAEALEHARAGRDYLVVTGTASGKTLCYNLPVLDALLRRRTSRAMYLFPTKALAQDQLRKLRGFLPDNPLRCETYDGDTPQSMRAGVRRHSHVILTNPDMLHVGILPNHTLWGEYLANLRYVVLDELHTYTGVFGSHAAHVFRRLLRICEHYGSSPRLIGCSATVANPLELAESLLGRPFALVDRDGSPAGTKTYVVWNASQPGDAGDEDDEERPRADGGGRAGVGGAFGQASRLVAGLIEEGVRTIAFVRTRSAAERLLLRTRALLLRRDSPAVDKLLAYRGGYLPEERRAIERRLVTGDLLGVYATTALELGVDIGGLDACVIVGYPGTIASFTQQAGRVGRAGRPSAVFLLPQASAIDQYLARHPEYLREHQAERAMADPSNRFILGGHLLCAAAELPIEERELGRVWADRPLVEGLLGVLCEAGLVEKRSRWYANPSLSPASEVSLRSSAGAAYRIVTGKCEDLVGTVDAATALFYLHPEAVYLHQGEKYLVKRCDTEKRVAYVEPSKAKHLTQPLVTFEAAVDEEVDARRIAGADVRYAEMTMTSKVVGYAAQPEQGPQTQETHPVELPPQTMETVGFLLSPATGQEDVSLADYLTRRGRSPLGSLHALEHAAVAVMPLLAFCGTQDVAGYSTLCDSYTGGPVVSLCDNYPGGVGVTEFAYERIDELLELARRTIAECQCEDGCPACVQAPNCGSNNDPLDKLGALDVIDLCLGREPAPIASPTPPEAGGPPER